MIRKKDSLGTTFICKVGSLWSPQLVAAFAYWISLFHHLWAVENVAPAETKVTMPIIIFTPTSNNFHGGVIAFSAGLQHQFQLSQRRWRSLKASHNAQAGCGRLVTGNVSSFDAAMPWGLEKATGRASKRKARKMMEVCKKLGIYIISKTCPALINEYERDQLRNFQRGSCKFGDKCKYPHDVRGMWKMKTRAQEADAVCKFGKHVFFSWCWECFLIKRWMVFCFVCWCPRTRVRLATQQCDGCLPADFGWRLTCTWVDSDVFFCSQWKLPLCFCSLSSPKYISQCMSAWWAPSMRRCKEVSLCNPMANCKRWGLTPVEAGIYRCCGDVVIWVISSLSGIATRYENGHLRQELAENSCCWQEGSRGCCGAFHRRRQS